MTANHERECKLDASSDAALMDIRGYVLANPAQFTPAARLPRPGIPTDMLGQFNTSLEVTEPRIRLYWDDADLTAYTNGIEIRQEPRPKGGIKQMVKLGGNASAANPVLDRMEHAANLDRFGIDFDAVKDITIRRRLKTLLGKKALKPIICMISQRMRLNYHPDGNPDVLIELGLDAPCRGHVFDGHRWLAPQLELELVNGPDDAVAANRVLAAESARFTQPFSLRVNTMSKPSAGFAHLKTVLATPAGRKAFETLEAGLAWWV